MSYALVTVSNVEKGALAAISTIAAEHHVQLHDTTVIAPRPNSTTRFAPFIELRVYVSEVGVLVQELVRAGRDVRVERVD